MKKTFKEWMEAQFDHDQLNDIVNHGVNGGFSGLIYYSETTALYQQYKDEVWEILYDEAEALGISILEMLAQLQLGKKASTAYQFENFLIWFAAEKIAYDVVCKEEV